MGLVIDNDWYGFQPFGSEDPAIVLQDTLRENSASVRDGDVTVTATGTAASVTYDSELGVTLAHGATPAVDHVYLRYQLTNADDYNPLSDAGCITFWLDNVDVFDAATKAYSDVLFSWSSSGNYSYLGRIGATSRVLHVVQNTNLPMQALLRSHNKNKPVRVDISIRNGIIETFFDYQLAMRNPHKELGAGIFAEMAIGDRSSSASKGSAEGVYWKDLMVSHRPIIRPVHPSLQRVMVLGDSHPVNGGYPATYYSRLGAQDDGLSGAGYNASSFVYDSGILTSIEQRFAQNNLFVGGDRVSILAEGGSGIETASPKTVAERIDQGIAAYRPAPTLAMIIAGTNDVTGHSASITDGTWRASYQTVIDKLVAWGCDKIIVSTNPPINVYTAGDTAPYKARDLEINAQIKILAAENSGIVKCVDAFNLFGGHDNFDPQDFGGLLASSDDRHASQWGLTKWGRWLADGAMELL